MCRSLAPLRSFIDGNQCVVLLSELKGDIKICCEGLRNRHAPDGHKNPYPAIGRRCGAESRVVLLTARWPGCWMGGSR